MWWGMNCEDHLNSAKLPFFIFILCFAIFRPTFNRLYPLTDTDILPIPIFLLNRYRYLNRFRLFFITDTDTDYTDTDIKNTDSDISVSVWYRYRYRLAFNRYIGLPLSSANKSYQLR